MRRIYLLYFSSERQYIRSLKNILGFLPGNINLYRLAFRHKSAANSVINGLKNSNERLEFLGDAVLGSIIADHLFKKFPYRDEGFLTEMRSKIVNRNFLNQLSRKIGLGDLIEFEGRISNQYLKQSSLYGDAFEALIGAIYLDKGFQFTQNFIIGRIVKNHVDIDQLEKTETNFKSKLIEWCQRNGKEVVFEQIENAHDEKGKLFSIKVFISSEEYGFGQDFTKKNAEKIAAEKACQALNL